MTGPSAATDGPSEADDPTHTEERPPTGRRPPEVPPANHGAEYPGEGAQ